MMRYSLVEDLRSGELLLPDYLAQVEARFMDREPAIQAFLHEEERFTRLFDEAETLLLAYPNLIERPQLFGTLVGVKDIFHVEGFTTRAGSRLPAELFQGREAESVTRLKSAGALILGKTVTTEFAYFSPGPTRNPHNLEHTPGGSSSGSAAAVAAGLCHLALGTQTIGSIIRPASFCGVIGVKPTYDRISRDGVMPLSPSLDHIGFFTSDVETALAAARVLYKDWNMPAQASDKPRLGIPEGPYLRSAAPERLAQFEKICKALQTAGYPISRIQLMTDFTAIRDRNQVIVAAEAARVHRDWFRQYANLYSEKFSELIDRGKNVTDDQLRDALSERLTFRADMEHAFTDHKIDLWICPSTIGPAPKGLESTGDPIMNLPWTQAGLPAMNLPAGQSEAGLPLGLQVIANWYQDEFLLFWAKELQKALSNL